MIADPLLLFPVPSTEGGYMQSPWWVGLRADTAAALTVLQIAAGIGGVVWYTSFANQAIQTENEGYPPPVNGPLWLHRVGDTVVTLFLASSATWAPLAHRAVVAAMDPSVSITAADKMYAIAACTPLWIAAVCVVALLAFTFEANPPPSAVYGLLALATVVVLVDGIGWSAVLIWRTLYK